MNSRSRLFLLFVCLVTPALAAVEFLPPGNRPLPPRVHALVGATVIPQPGQVLSNATIILRDGFIVAVGVKVAVPADAQVWTMNGTTIYAGLIDPCLTLAEANIPVSTTDTVPVHGSLTSGAAPFHGVVGHRHESGPGYDIPALTPERRRVQSYVPDTKTLADVRALGFTAGNLTPTRGILRGTSTFITLAEGGANEVVLRPDVFQHLSLDAHAGRDGAFPGSLMGVISVVRQIFFDAEHYALDVANFDKAAPGARQRPAFNPALEALRAAREKKIPVVFEPGSALMVDRAMQLARELNLNPVMLACGQEWRRPELAKASGAPFIVPVNFPSLPVLPDDEDWTQITLDQLRAWDWAAENPALLRQQGLTVALTTHGLADKKLFRKNLQAAVDRGLSEADALAALTTVPAKLCGLDTRLGTIAPGKIANLTVVEGSYFDPEKKVREVWIDGRVYRIEQTPVKWSETKPATTNQTATAESAKPEKKKPDVVREVLKARAAKSPLAGRGPIATPPAVLVRHATIWTGRSILTNADLLVRDGLIKSIGEGLGVPGDNILVIEAGGRHVTAGLIDGHSHTAILGEVNEGTLPSTAMVRIADVINSETDTLYQQLAGGLTAANLLHGSANPIGGQNAVIKLREGATPEELKFAGAPAGIKFALGENVKQANWGDRYTTRFPQSRMGVRTFYVNRFEAARQYQQAWAAFKKSGGVPPRRDLELEALVEILEGRRLIHCHSYRQDEILMFLRVCETYGIKIGTLQHILEGYKVADEIAKHGAGASSFADWWAYKSEVFDAIPYNGSLMRDRGVLVSFNSDSSDLARRLHLEAAKAVKYGRTPEIDALNFVTLNPARQLGIDQWVGSLEAGKHADFVIWSKSPLDTGTVCLETWIDGKKYFDRSLANGRAGVLAAELTALLEKARKVQKPGEDAPKDTKPAATTTSDAFFRVALEKAHAKGQDCGECARRTE